jgi:allophycocyanin-B
VVQIILIPKILRNGERAMPLSERAQQLIPKARIMSFANWPYNQSAIAIFQQADDETRYLTDNDLTNLVTLEPELLKYSQKNQKLRDNAINIIDSARQNVLSQFTTITEPGGDLYPPYRAEACWRDFWNFLRCITYGIAGQQIPYTSAEGLENMRLLYQELQVPLAAMICGLEGLKQYGLENFNQPEKNKITPYFDHLITVMKKF